LFHRRLVKESESRTMLLDGIWWVVAGKAVVLF